MQHMVLALIYHTCLSLPIALAHEVIRLISNELLVTWMNFLYAPISLPVLSPSCKTP